MLGCLVFYRIDGFWSGRCSALCRRWRCVLNLLGCRFWIHRWILILGLRSAVVALQLLMPILELQGPAISWLFDVLHGLLCALGRFSSKGWYRLCRSRCRQLFVGHFNRLLTWCINRLNKFFFFSILFEKKRNSFFFRLIVGKRE